MLPQECSPLTRIEHNADRILTKLYPNYRRGGIGMCSRCLTLTRQGSMCGAPKLFYHAVVHLNNFNLVIKYRAMCDDAVSNNILKCGCTRRYCRAHMSFPMLTISPRTAMECLPTYAPNNAPLHKFALPPRT